MTNTPNLEIIETLTFPLLSSEIQTGDVELTVTCRVAWDMDNGMYCEPTSYNWNGTDHPIGLFMEVSFDAFVRSIVASEMTAEHLDTIMRENPAFEFAVRHEYDLIDTDRVEYMEAVY